MTVSDIVSWLRTQAGPHGLAHGKRQYTEAADEIERLRAEVRALEEKRVELNVTIGERDAEIERLRTAMVRAQKETGTSTSTWHVLEDALRESTKVPVECADCGEVVDDLQAHCERNDINCLIHHPSEKWPETGKIRCPWCHTEHSDESASYGYCSDKCRDDASEAGHPDVMDWIERESEKGSSNADDS
jgi:endogenous inhibitor of DNA gyrase (YacG/DUF329 family)